MTIMMIIMMIEKKNKKDQLDLKRQCMANVNNSNVYIYEPKDRSV